MLTITEVLGLADHMAARRFRVLILLATFASLRWGGAIALRDAIWTWRPARSASAASTWKQTAPS